MISKRQQARHEQTDLVKRARAAQDFTTLSKLEAEAMQKERDAGENSAFFTDAVYYIRELSESLQDDSDAHPFAWKFSEAIQRVI